MGLFVAGATARTPALILSALGEVNDRVEGLRVGGDAIITVADNGPGIPADERENVFRRFYRLDQSRSATDVGGGNGLGLSMVSAVVAMHNGRIELQDNGPGLRVVVTLPLTQNEEEAAGKARERRHIGDL